MQQTLETMFSKSLVHYLELLQFISLELQHAHKYAVSAAGAPGACNWSDSLQTLQTKLPNPLLL